MTPIDADAGDVLLTSGLGWICLSCCSFDGSTIDYRRDLAMKSAVTVGLFSRTCWNPFCLRYGELVTDSVRAIVLAGGSARRLGGIHKPSLKVGGIAIIARICAALDAYAPVVIGLGDDVPDGIPVTREDPPGGGPVAAIAAGLDALPQADVVLVIAGDLPFFDAKSADLLVSNLGTFDGCLYADSQTHWLCSCWRARPLRARIAAVDPSGMSVRALVAPLRITTIQPLSAATIFDVDTREDLERTNIIIAGGRGLADE